MDFDYLRFGGGVQHFKVLAGKYFPGSSKGWITPTVLLVLSIDRQFIYLLVGCVTAHG